MDSFEVTSDARKCFSTPNGSFQSQLLTIWNRKCPLSLICSCSFWPLAPGSVLSTSTRSMESLLVLTSGRKLPLCSMDEAALISFRKQAKFCMESTPSSFLMVNESLRENRCCVIVLDVSNTLLHITQPDSLEHLGVPMQTEPQTQNLKPSLVAPDDEIFTSHFRHKYYRKTEMLGDIKSRRGGGRGGGSFKQTEPGFAFRTRWRSFPKTNQVVFQPKHNQTVSQRWPCVYYGYHDNKDHVTMTMKVTWLRLLELKMCDDM